MPTTQEHRFVNDIARERHHQREKWGHDQHDSQHSNFGWLAILTVRMGKLAQAILNVETAGHVRHRLVQVAAVASAWAEQIGRPANPDGS